MKERGMQTSEARKRHELKPRGMQTSEARKRLLSPNQLRHQDNLNHAHGVRVSGTVYLDGKPRTDQTVVWAKRQLTLVK